jgi:hypothetical protein
VSKRWWIALAVLGVSIILILINQVFWRVRTSRPPRDAIAYDLVLVDGEPPPWVIINNAVMVLQQTGGQLQLEPNRSAGRAWTTTTLQQGAGSAAVSRTVTNRNERFVWDSDSLQVMITGRCNRITVFTVSEDRSVLKQRSVRESGSGCDNAPPDVAARLRALREQQREYRLINP